MTQASSAKPQVDRALVLQAAASLGLLGSGASSLARLMSMLCDQKVSGQEIASLIENHPVLCARVLRVANSAYYGQLRSVTTIKRAVLLLGLDGVRGIAAAACVDRAMPRRTKVALIDMPALLRHSLATAVAAESLARIRHPSLASEAFIAGVMHNLGVAVQVCIDTSGINAMIEARRADPVRNIRELEFEHSTVRHEECVAIIFDDWQLPDSLVAATGHHHNPVESPEAHRELTTLVHLGAMLALGSGHTFSLEPAPVKLDLHAADRIGLCESDLDSVATALPERVESLLGALLDA
jgi:HD-like signal output (HDOD) protein